jgi:hypothetical protein
MGAPPLQWPAPDRVPPGDRFDLVERLLEVSREALR